MTKAELITTKTKTVGRYPSKRAIEKIINALFHWSTTFGLIAAFLLSSCTLFENDQYSVTTGTDIYLTIHQKWSAMVSLAGVVCNYDANCVRDSVQKNIQISGWGAAQWNTAVNDHADQLANVMHQIHDAGGSVNTGGPCIQMWYNPTPIWGGSGFNFVPAGVDNCI